MTVTAVDRSQSVARAPSPRVLRHGSVSLRSSQEIECMAAAGAVVADALRAAEAAAVAGARTLELDAAVRSVIAANDALPAFLNYPNPSGGAPFPAACCTSVNEEVVHGIPSRRTLIAGDIVSIDVGVEIDGWFADAASTVVVSGVSADAGRAAEADPRHRALVACAWDVLGLAISMMEPGRKWSEIAARMQETAIGAGFGMVDGWMGHGIGRAVHESPQVPCMVTAGLRERRDFTLLPGMVLAVEPLLVLGGGSVIGADGCATGVPVTSRCDGQSDGWTVVVASGQPAAHVEHTVAITRQGPRVLTVTAQSNSSRSVSSHLLEAGAGMPAVRLHG